MPQSSATDQAELLERVLSHERQGRFALDRSAPRQKLRRDGLPLPRKGLWQFSDLLAILDDAIELAVAGSGGDLLGELKREAPANAELSRARVAPSSAGLGDYPLIDVNGIFAQDIVKVRACARKDDSKRMTIQPAGRSIDRIEITVENDANFEVAERIQSGNRVVFCDVQNGATLDFSLVMESSADISYHALVLNLHENSTVNLHLAARGAKLSRNDIAVNILGRNASARLSGGWDLDHDSHLDIQTCVSHRVGDSTSEQNLHGVVDDSARSSFTGRIRVDRGANGSEAHLTNRNLAISSAARAHTQPELEIYTDDVICSHGATTGQLDEDALFLLRSRGIAAERAQAILKNGFLRSVVHTIEGNALLGLA